MSRLEETLALHLRAEKISGWVREHRFHPPRKWRFDFAWPELKFAVEVQGGVYTQGRHTRGKGYEGDLKKKHQAMLLGWDVAEFSGSMVEKAYAIDTIKLMLELKS